MVAARTMVARWEMVAVSGLALIGFAIEQRSIFLFYHIFSDQPLSIPAFAGTGFNRNML